MDMVRNVSNREGQCLSLVNLSLNLHYLLGSKVISQLERYFVSQGQYRTIIGMLFLFFYI